MDKMSLVELTTAHSDKKPHLDTNLSNLSYFLKLNSSYKFNVKVISVVEYKLNIPLFNIKL